MKKIECSIQGVIINCLNRFDDSRGWLTELFRIDELPEDFKPEMAYISSTLPGQIRGPHEHKYQTDYFCIIGPSNFKVYMWDNRNESTSSEVQFSFVAGEDNRVAIVVPPGVVHGYKNIGQVDGLVINAPNKLFAGKNKADPVDEIRYEDDPSGRFIID